MLNLVKWTNTSCTYTHERNLKTTDTDIKGVSQDLYQKHAMKANKMHNIASSIVVVVVVVYIEDVVLTTLTLYGWGEHAGTEFCRASIDNTSKHVYLIIGSFTSLP